MYAMLILLIALTAPDTPYPSTRRPAADRPPAAAADPPESVRELTAHPERLVYLGGQWVEEVYGCTGRIDARRAYARAWTAYDDQVAAHARLGVAGRGAALRPPIQASFSQVGKPDLKVSVPLTGVR